MEVALVKVSRESGVDLGFDADMWRDGVLLKHEKRLEQCRRPRSRLAMADLRLYSADIQRRYTGVGPCCGVLRAEHTLS